MNIRNQKVLKIFQGPLEVSEGVDMPGIAGPIWYYADLFMQMENSLILRIVCGGTGIVETLPENAIPIKDEELRKIEGERSIVDIYSGEEPYIYILFDDGSHLEYSFQPGGSRWKIGRFDESFKDDYEEIFTSLVDGQKLSWSQLIVWNNMA